MTHDTSRELSYHGVLRRYDDSAVEQYYSGVYVEKTWGVCDFVLWEYFMCGLTLSSLDSF